MFSLFGYCLVQDLVERILAILSDEQGILRNHVYLIKEAPFSDKHFSHYLLFSDSGQVVV